MVIDDSVKEEEELIPFLRGHFHQSAFFLGLGGCIAMIAVSSSTLARISALVYMLCLCALFGVSSLYHRISWPPKIRIFFRKLDHTIIFVFIAGTVTPIAILGLGGSAGKSLLVIFWVFAFFGLIKEFFWKSAPRWSSGLSYIIMGWLAFPYLSQLHEKLGLLNTCMIVLGGIVYTFGALIYLFRWPNPFPKVFGFHEIFHALTVVAGILHFIVIFNLVTHH